MLHKKFKKFVPKKFKNSQKRFNYFLKKSKFTETQIVLILKEADAGLKVEKICRTYGISPATYYNWKSKYGGMEASDVKRLEELENENSRLKKIYANLSLEHEAVKGLMRKRVGDSQ